ncbi:hypothetical protein M7I_3859 [Glarea lozoyensis 74030]|uniref:Uncharacterized protein n=1 Tax=Glarea lozoyensis (strain ATCC 74030 / MF5533) TaxID=1104152 RepID=H0EMM0_GLAL7|nr:hypothetical protein M7I_3859 [Glarea lozoyensis 74030]
MSRGRNDISEQAEAMGPISRLEKNSSKNSEFDLVVDLFSILSKREATNSPDFFLQLGTTESTASTAPKTRRAAQYNSMLEFVIRNNRQNNHQAFRPI